MTGPWMELVQSILYRKHGAVVSSERKYVEAQTLTIPGPDWERGAQFSLSDLGYKDHGNKIQSLNRTYFNEESVEEARRKFKERAAQKITCVGVSTIAASKRSDSQGHCIRSIIVSYFKLNKNTCRVRVDIEYRTTELLRKFGADLIYLRNHYIPAILKDNPWGVEHPHEVGFYFPTCYVSILFLPVLFNFLEPVPFLEKMKRDGDPSLYRRCMFRVASLIEDDPETFRFVARRRMWKLGERILTAGDFEDLQTYIRKEKFNR